jgi:hypothetical protein
MRHFLCFLLLACAATSLPAQDQSEGPKSEKAQKSYKEALELIHQRRTDFALDSFKKADKLDEGRCIACQKKMIKYGIELHDWKTAETAATEMVAEAQGEKSVALAHFEFGIVLMDEAMDKHKDEIFERSHNEFSKALAAV